MLQVWSWGLGPFCGAFTARSSCVCVSSFLVRQNVSFHSPKMCGTGKLGTLNFLSECVSESKWLFDFQCRPVMNWRLVQGVALPSPCDSWDWLQQTSLDPECWSKLVWKDRCLVTERPIYQKITTAECMLILSPYSEKKTIWNVRPMKCWPTSIHIKGSQKAGGHICTARLAFNCAKPAEQK